MAPRTKRDPKPIERRPHGMPIPYNWGAKRGGIPYRPRDRKDGKPAQEDWGTVAKKFGVGVKELIYFNFMTDNPDEVNWYLHHYVGCKKVSPSGNNWMFSNDANPGVIYIPPADDEDIDFAPEDICVFMPGEAKKFMNRLFAISQGMSGNKGSRIKRLVQVILKAGYPGCRDLWYYNSMSISVYVDVRTDNAKRREMTKATGRAFPFDGDSGVYAQSGTFEQHRGKWRIHAVNDLFDTFTCDADWDANKMEDLLERIDEDMYNGWHALDMVDGIASTSGDAWGAEVEEFINHVKFLMKDDTNLYWALAP
jgi:hypothetical protein